MGIRLFVLAVANISASFIGTLGDEGQMIQGGDTRVTSQFPWETLAKERVGAMPYSGANKVNIWYEVAGDGPAMILVHANPFDNTLWTYQVSHYSTWFKVISIDIRGYGRSVKQTTPFTLKDMCD